MIVLLILSVRGVKNQFRNTSIPCLRSSRPYIVRIGQRTAGSLIPCFPSALVYGVSVSIPLSDCSLVLYPAFRSIRQFSASETSFGTSSRQLALLCDTRPCGCVPESRVDVRRVLSTHCSRALNKVRRSIFSWLYPYEEVIITPPGSVDRRGIFQESAPLKYPCGIL